METILNFKCLESTHLNISISSNLKDHKVTNRETILKLLQYFLICMTIS